MQSVIVLVVIYYSAKIISAKIQVLSEEIAAKQEIASKTEEEIDQVTF